MDWRNDVHGLTCIQTSRTKKISETLDDFKFHLWKSMECLCVSENDLVAYHENAVNQPNIAIGD